MMCFATATVDMHRSWSLYDLYAIYFLL